MKVFVISSGCYSVRGATMEAACKVAMEHVRQTIAEGTLK